jgi:hypothetical protein
MLKKYDGVKLWGKIIGNRKSRASGEAEVQRRILAVGSDHMAEDRNLECDALDTERRSNFGTIIFISL